MISKAIEGYTELLKTTRANLKDRLKIIDDKLKYILD